ncbi:oocyte zinc finger protein XlCOF6 [Aplysia californica]|uniref:Oocyte zinc finger protein XlCOF6 n=1 Tax=Aplysia californica TaxID=6500 RepID=A0ABM0K734_APLCA|nr:oocyte zinc finger protein XlCOF6 [Aplysia californica]
MPRVGKSKRTFALAKARQQKRLNQIQRKLNGGGGPGINEKDNGNGCSPTNDIANAIGPAQSEMPAANQQQDHQTGDHGNNGVIERSQRAPGSENSTVTNHTRNPSSKITSPSDPDDFVFEKFDRSGRIIVRIDSGQIMTVVFEQSVHIQVLFDPLDTAVDSAGGPPRSSRPPGFSSRVKRELADDGKSSCLVIENAISGLERDLISESGPLHGPAEEGGEFPIFAVSQDECGKEKSNEPPGRKRRRSKLEEEEEECYCHYCDLPLPSRAKFMSHLEKKHPNRRDSKKLIREYSSKNENMGDSGEDLSEDGDTDDTEAFECGRCPDSFRTQSGYDRHLKWHLREEYGGEIPVEVYRQNFLENKKPVRGEINKGLLESGEDRRSAQETTLEIPKLKFTCSLCEDKFPSVLTLRRHYLEKHEDELTCKYCGIISNTPVACRKHSKTHGTFCFVCKELFPSLGILNLHWRDRHLHAVDSEGNKLLEQCPKCIIVFADRKKLVKHMEIHKRVEQGRKYVCHICAKVMLSKPGFDSHMQGHSTDKGVTEQIPCDQCGKMFANEHAVNSHHARVHRAKPYACKICGKAFSLSSLLRRHEYHHIASRPYQCSVCKKCFSQGYNLSVHMRTHTKEKPFSCPHCSQSFSHKCSLQGHVASKHKSDTMLG